MKLSYMYIHMDNTDLFHKDAPQFYLTRISNGYNLLKGNLRELITLFIILKFELSNIFIYGRATLTYIGAVR